MVQQALSVVGAIAILLAFAFNQIGVWRPKDLSYLALNLVGSGLLAFIALRQGQAGFLILEGAWAVISFVSLARVVYSAR
jgi:hypothetical protein